MLARRCLGGLVQQRAAKTFGMRQRNFRAQRLLIAGCTVSRVDVVQRMNFSHKTDQKHTVESRPQRREGEMFSTVLIANRGEIAVRVSRTCKQLGVKTVAVYSEQDKSSFHVAAADQAVLVGPAPASQSYLDYRKIIRVALETGAQAIHPGYGFLSENAEFSRACSEAGLVFIGPPPSAIEAMGSKSEAKRIMSDAGVPITPGYYGNDQTVERFTKEAEKIGYPVLIKAVHGGGGKGMRLVYHPTEMADAMESAKREAIKSFGSEGLLIEKYIVRPRHVEVQVFADNFGNAVYLFERDCSVQRRHQKIIEEAPAPNISEELRKRLGEAAVNAARAVGYRGAGTVEFILDCDAPDGRFYFMEMNTRLQVEHPITEMITKQDLVEWQLLVASGRPLPLTQSQLRIHGHAFEARIYAENPSNDFLPAPGPIVEMSTPAETFVAGSGSEAYSSAHGSVRIDTGVREGDVVSVYYDPMIAKLIVHDVDRVTALRRLHQKLGEFHVRGLFTNLAFLQALASHPSFVNAELDTGFIGRHHAQLFDHRLSPSECDRLAILATLRSMLESFASPAGVQDPWNAGSPLRLNGSYGFTKRWNIPELGAKDHIDVHLRWTDKNLTPVDWSRRDVIHSLALDVVVSHGVHNRKYSTQSMSLSDKGSLRVWLSNASGEQQVLTACVSTVPLGGEIVSYVDHKILKQVDTMGFDLDGADHGHAGSLSAPMPGKIVRVLAQPSQVVKKGDPLLIMEAMKMEHTIRAPFNGVVHTIHYAVGDQVEDKAVLIDVEKTQ